MLIVFTIISTSASSLTAAHFQDPVIIVGDDRGGVNSLKLSPNLRKVRVDYV